MCYIVLLATDSSEDLSRHNAGVVSFSRTLPGLAEEAELRSPATWLVTTGTCSCGFRHLHVDSVDLGFAEPADWFPESAEDLEATRHVIQVIRRLHRDGAAVECIDVWESSSGTRPLATVRVNLRAVTDAAFRFFEGYRFTFVDESEA